MENLENRNFSLKNMDIKSLKQRMSSKQDVIKFFHSSLNLYYPKGGSFDSKFLYQTFRGEKLLLPCGSSTEDVLNSLRTDRRFDKKSLLNMLLADPSANKYFPDNPDVNGIDKGFILSVMMHIKPDLYKNVYLEYLLAKERSFKRKLENVKIGVIPEIENALNNFHFGDHKQGKKFIRYSNYPEYAKKM